MACISASLRKDLNEILAGKRGVTKKMLAELNEFPICDKSQPRVGTKDLIKLLLSDKTQQAVEAAGEAAAARYAHEPACSERVEHLTVVAAVLEALLVIEE